MDTTAKSNKAVDTTAKSNEAVDAKAMSNEAVDTTVKFSSMLGAVDGKSFRKLQSSDKQYGKTTSKV